MRVRKCRRCKTSIPRNARVCPYCFKKQWTETVIILLSMVLVLVGIGTYLRNTTKVDIGDDGSLNDSLKYEKATIEMDETSEAEDFQTKTNGEQIIESRPIATEDLMEEQREKERQEKERLQKERELRMAAEKERIEKERREKEQRDNERLRKEQLTREQMERERIRMEIEAREKAISEQVEQDTSRSETPERESEHDRATVEDNSGDTEPKEGTDMQDAVPDMIEEKDVAEDTIKVEQEERPVEDQ